MDEDEPRPRLDADRVQRELVRVDPRRRRCAAPAAAARTASRSRSGRDTAARRPPSRPVAAPGSVGTICEPRCRQTLYAACRPVVVAGEQHRLPHDVDDREVTGPVEARGRRPDRRTSTTRTGPARARAPRRRRRRTSRAAAALCSLLTAGPRPGGRPRRGRSTSGPPRAAVLRQGPRRRPPRPRRHRRPRPDSAGGTGSPAGSASGRAPRR